MTSAANQPFLALLVVSMTMLGAMGRVSVTVSTDFGISGESSSVFKIIATLQVVSNPLLDRQFSLHNGTKIPNPIHGTAWERLRNLGADHVRFQPWFPYPHKAVAELLPPEAGKPTS